MSKMIFKLSFGLLAVAGFIQSAMAAESSGYVPAAVMKYALTPVNRLAATNVLNLAIGLPVRNQSALDALQQQIYDPASTNYHKYLTPAQFSQQFGPTTNDYQTVIAFAQAHGLTVKATHPNRLVLDVSGSAADIEAAFQVQMQVYNHPTEPRTFFAPATAPVINASLPILHISGLDNYYVPHPQMISRAQSRFQQQYAAVSPSFGTAPGGNYMGSDFRTAYAVGTTLTGAGQSVGLIQFDGFFASDVAAYATLIGLTNPPNVITVPIDGGVAFPGGGNSEVAMDIEMIFAMAPGVSNIYVYEAPNPSPWVDLLSRMANDNLAKQLSCSWGGGPPDAIAEQIFQQMALQGQSFYNAVGDTDAFIDSVNPAVFPSESPNITQVGGTVLTTGGGAVYGSEKVWNDRFPRFPGYQGSSGGISPDYTIPTWQQGMSMTNNHGSTTQRNMPDVALTALNVWVITDNGVGYASGGTSSAAPLWAAYTALINQQAAINGLPPVGFLNPAIYNLAKGSNYTNVFNDVTVGDNTWPSSPTNFFAVAGYDLCTGLGTPKGTNLINALTIGTNTVYVPFISAPKGPWGTNLNVMNGTDPNGPWFLFVQDDSLGNVGVISNGWFLTLTTANPVGIAADNALYLTPTNKTILIGNPWSCVLAVTNYGPAYSTNVYVTNALPLNVLFVSAVPSIGVTTNRGANLVWAITNLAVNAGGTLTLNFMPNATGSFTNSAVVSSDSDPNPDDNAAVATVTVNPAVPPAFSAVTYSAGSFRFAVTGSPGAAVVIQNSTNLVNWVNIYTNISPFNYTNLNSTIYPQLFYRAVVGP